MKKTIVDYLEETAEQYYDKISFADNKREAKYGELVKNSQAIGTAIINNCIAQTTEQDISINQPIAIFLDKNVECLESMLGTVYSGNFYTVLDTKSPNERIELILETLNPKIILTDEKNEQKAKEFVKNDEKIVIYEDLIETKIEVDKIQEVKSKIIDTNPMYILFTSGSTGVPKGTVVSHNSVIKYSKWVKETFNINENTIFGSQTPFYFSMSITDVFSTIMTGATFYIIPKMYFSFPVRLLEYMNEKKINTIYWVPSALCIVANTGALEVVKLTYLKKVLFAGEVMPVKQLNMWIEKIPEAMYANLYGPTETTDICTYYVIDRKFDNTETLPIGKHCDNCDVIIIKEDGTEAKKGEQGELCARGPFLASGYYKNPKKTSEAFVQNPLNKNYPEVVYKTGDIVKYNDKDEIIYLSRKDFQIKHMGYRIELGEIENRINNIDGIITCACIYDTKESKIVLFYQGNIDEIELLKRAKDKLTTYMIPNKIIRLERLPYNANGKIDRKLLKKINEGE